MELSFRKKTDECIQRVAEVGDDGAAGRLRFLVILAGVTLLPRLWPPLGRDGLGPMEVYQVLMSRVPWNADWWRSLIGAYHGPVAPVALWIGGLPGGWFASDGGQRLIPVLAGVAVVFAAYASCRRFGNPWIARFAAVFTASSALLVDFSRDARLYSVHALLVFLAVWSVDLALVSPRPWRAAVAALIGALACLNHLMALPFLAGACLGVALRKGCSVRAKLTAAGGITVGMISCMPLLLLITPHVAHDPDLRRHDLEWWLNQVIFLGNGVFLWLFAAAVAVVPHSRQWLKPASDRAPEDGGALYGWSALCAVVLAGVFGLVIVPASRHEYLVPAVPLFAVWLATAAAGRAPQLRAALVVAGVVLPLAIMGVGIVRGKADMSGVREMTSARGAVAAARVEEPADAVIVLPPYMGISARFYWPEAAIMKLEEFEAHPPADRPPSIIVLYWPKECDLGSTAGPCRRIRELLKGYTSATVSWRGEGAEVWRFRR